MEISKASAVAIHGLAYIADAPDQAPLDVKEIADGLGMPQGYLAKTLQTLSRNQLVYSRRGPRGGYQLARKPRDISLLDIIEAIEGPAPTRRCEFHPGEHCRLFERCKIRIQLESLREQTRELYQSVTLDAFGDQFAENQLPSGNSVDENSN
jgi:Rrf2 family protein